VSWTTRFRVVFVSLFVIEVLVTLLGWAWFERDPAQLDGLLMFTAGVIGVGEGSNIGKRATWKREAVEVEG